MRVIRGKRDGYRRPCGAYGAVLLGRRGAYMVFFNRKDSGTGARTMAHKSLKFASVSALLIAAPAWGHHTHAMYDSAQQITLIGTVKELQWSNPHVFLYMVVLDENDQAANWTLEGGSPAQLLAQGWPRGNPKPGDPITVIIRPLKAGGRGGLIRTVTFADNTNFNYVSEGGRQ